MHFLKRQSNETFSSLGDLSRRGQDRINEDRTNEDRRSSHPDQEQLISKLLCFQRLDADTLDDWAASFCREFMSAG